MTGQDRTGQDITGQDKGQDMGQGTGQDHGKSYKLYTKQTIVYHYNNITKSYVFTIIFYNSIMSDYYKVIMSKYNSITL